VANGQLVCGCGNIAYCKVCHFGLNSPLFSSTYLEITVEEKKCNRSKCHT
jgi:hypothetical protein